MPSPTSTRTSNPPDLSNSRFVSDKVLSIIRLVFAIITTGIIIWRIVGNKAIYFYYLTHWNWILNFFYFWTVFIVKRNCTSTQLLFSATNSISWIVTIVYWLLLFNGNESPEGLASGIIQHTFNLIFPLVDLFLGTISPFWIQLYSPIAFSFLYMTGVIIVHLCFGLAWPYNFLVTINGAEDGISWGKSIGFCFGFWIVCAIFFALTMGLVRVREKLYEKSRRAGSEVRPVQMEQV